MILSVPDEGYSRNVRNKFDNYVLITRYNKLNLQSYIYISDKKIWNHNLLKIVPHRQEIKKTNI